tara:strand:- start:1648 stop:2097 length:450 start_codon:yes stop_codon:yes gene_type:complete
MAKWFIFEQGDLRNVALTDDEKDSLMQHRQTYVPKEVTDSQADDALNVVRGFNLNGDTITDFTFDWAESNRSAEASLEVFEKWLQDSIIRIGYFLNSNKQHPDFSEWKNVQTQLKAVDISSITFPITGSPQQWFSAQPGHSSKKMLQLP